MDQTRTILHLGLGAFHRAHQAAWLQDLIDAGDHRWRIVAGNLRGDMQAVETALIAQGGRYVLETVSPAGDRAFQTITAIDQVLPFQADLGDLVRIGADPATRIISMTVTEVGYFLRPDLSLMDEAADLAADLTTGSHRTVYGALSRILAARMVAGAGPVTLLSCDNLRANGDKLGAGLRAFLTARGQPDLLAWCADNTSTPNTMVDRITPRPPADLAARVLAETGLVDAAPVMAERFRQWVVEDHFVAGRPDLGSVGVEFVADVKPYEEAKISIINAGHSAVAWAGVLKGYIFIHEGARDPDIAAVARAYFRDAAIPCLTPSPVDLAAYAETTLERFGNPEMRDTNQRVVADSWAKIPVFIAPTIRKSLRDGRDIASVAMLPALYLRMMQRWGRGVLPFDYQDQAMDAEAMRAILAAPDPVAALCAEPRLWGDLAGDPRLAAAVSGAFEALPA